MLHGDHDLTPLRDQIDTIDSQILKLLNQRAGLAQSIGQVKAQTQAPVMRPEREAEVIRRLLVENAGPLPDSSIELLFREIMSACRALEHHLVVAYLGPEGTYSEQAVWRHFGRCIQALPCSTLEEAVGCVESDRADFCVIPLENSAEGSVSRTLDLLLQTNLLITAEVSLAIDHLLLTRASSLAEITEVCAHPQALAQCRRWLLANMPNAQQTAVSSNAEGALRAQKNVHIAAIAGLVAQQCYGLTPLAEHIQDDFNNKTRFLVLGRLKSGVSQADRTSFILSVPNQPGAVYRMLEPLSKHGVSMSRFESRPARTGRWEYYFYIDVLGHQDEPALKAAIAELQACTSFFKCLGSYSAVV